MSGRGIPRGCSPDVRDVVRALCREGWDCGRTGSSHFRLTHPEAARPVVIPHGLFGPRAKGKLCEARRLLAAEPGGHG